MERHVGLTMGTFPLSWSAYAGCLKRYGAYAVCEAHFAEIEFENEREKEP